MHITQQELQARFVYDEFSGTFCNRNSKGKLIAGAVAGKLHNQGYWAISIDNKTYLAHRLAWLYMTGNEPKHDIDHIDLNRLNNSFSNLRDVTRQVNQQNAKCAKRSNKTSGLLGVSLCKQTGRWVAQIRINGIKKNLGRYDTAELGHEAYLHAKRKHHIGNTI